MAKGGRRACGAQSKNQRKGPQFSIFLKHGSYVRTNVRQHHITYTIRAVSSMSHVPGPLTPAIRTLFVRIVPKVLPSNHTLLSHLMDNRKQGLTRNKLRALRAMGFLVGVRACEFLSSSGGVV